MSEYDEHREFLLESKLDLREVQGSMLTQVDIDVRMAKERKVPICGLETATLINIKARKTRECIRKIFTRHLDEPVQAFYAFA
ncbi:MAG: hypothetical protein ABIA92_01435 [Patescibacteria group bacterium]